MHTQRVANTFLTDRNSPNAYVAENYKPTQNSERIQHNQCHNACGKEKSI